MRRLRGRPKGRDGIKEKRGRERRASERERERERDEARVSSVAPKCLSSFLGFRKDVPERERRPNERTSDFVLIIIIIIIRFLSRIARTMISKMFSTTRIPRWKKKISFFAHRPSGNLVRPGVVDPVRARAFRSTFHHEHIFSRKKTLSLRLLRFVL